MSQSDRHKSAFAADGFRPTIDRLLAEIQQLYLADQIPWVVGYSGGKDSTAVLQLIWLALDALPAHRRTKTVHVISTDTLVENPVVAAWVNRSHDVMGEAARTRGLPLEPHRLTPAISDTFWVNLIGRGYPAPRPRFRWCTSRMKINPSDAFISGLVKQNGEAIVVLGTRKAESSIRSARMTVDERSRIRERLDPHATMPNSFVYAPIADWSNDDVWLFLMQIANPWGYTNKALLNLYQGASPDAECPVVLDTSTPSCGDSRFGCWVCTMVSKDRSMTAMIQNDEEKEWMAPLLQLRDALAEPDRDKRDFRRMSGNVQLFYDRPIPGPYTQAAREAWLKQLLEAQERVRSHPAAPEEARNVELITLAELQEIRRIWVIEKHEIEDSLPAIYESATGIAFSGQPLDDAQPFGAAEMSLLRRSAGDDELHFGLVRELLEVQRGYRTMARRADLFARIEKALRRGFYDDEEEAADKVRREQRLSTLVDDLSANEHLARERLAEIARALNEPAAVVVDITPGEEEQL